MWVCAKLGERITKTNGTQGDGAIGHAFPPDERINITKTIIYGMPMFALDPRKNFHTLSHIYVTVFL